MLSKEDLKLYYDSRSVCEVLSGLTSNLTWIDKYKIILEDFITPTHRVLFTVLYNLNINLDDLNLIRIVMNFRGILLKEYFKY